MQPHTHFYSLRLHSDIMNQITYGLLTCSPIFSKSRITPASFIRFVVLLRLNWLKANLIDLAIRLLLIPEERWMTLVFRSRSNTEHFIISQWLSRVVSKFTRYCLRRQRISITAKLLAIRSKPLNSNRRTRPECRDSFCRKALNTVWAESLKNFARAMDRRTKGSMSYRLTK